MAAIARKLVKEVRPEALKLEQSQADAQRASDRLLQQLQGKNPTLAYRITTGSGARPKKLGLESLGKFEVKDAVGSIYSPGMRIDLLPKDRKKYQANPLTFHLTLQDTGVKKFLRAMETGRAQKFTAGEFGDFQMNAGLFTSPEGAAAMRTLVMKPHSGKTTPVRLTFGSGSGAVVYDLMTHRVVRAGTWSPTVS